MFDNAEVIHTYTRAAALADGVLIEADTVETGICHSAGFRLPIAFTAAAWSDTVAWDEGINANKAEFTGQSEAGRLWDVLTMARHASREGAGQNLIAFEVLRVPATGTKTDPELAQLVIHIGPGDHGEPVLTVMLPNED